MGFSSFRYWTTVALLAAVTLLAPVAAQDRPAQTSQRRNVAILIFDGVQIIDYTGPYEVFGQAGMTVFTVAEKPEAITTNMGMRVVPSYTLENAPAASILVLPGGSVHNIQQNRAIIGWLRENAEKAEVVLSVCNGAFFLAAAGLLDGLEATTYAPMIDHFRHQFPRIKVVTNRRFVDNGRMITSGGLSAGLDAALHVVAKLDGAARAREIANNMEYNWDPDSGYVRTALADLRLANVIDVNPPLRGKTLRYEGDERRWVSEYEVPRRGSLQEFAAQLEESAAMYGWKNVEKERSGDSIRSRWSFSDERGRSWRGSIEVEQTSGRPQRFRLTLAVELEER